ncbi:MAG TPA: NAD(P)-dependent oxidoreductase [Nocardioidaceae bacterium]|nr:NAD(P)-dependent oxidoreductase [Nocardioidaceae bacterium]
MKVLVTGAAGSIGTVVCTGLVDRGHDVVGLDRVPEPEGFVGGWFTGDCADLDAVRSAFAEHSGHAGFHGVVHLAGIPDEASLPEEMTSHVYTTAALLEVMLEYGVRRIVYASSNHAVGRAPRQDVLGNGILPRPDTFYGVAKVAAEALLRLYVDRHGIDAVALRIGSFQPQPESVRQLSTWLSHDDAVRLVEAALLAPDPGFAILYGISNNTRAWWDLEPGRALGYEPQDDAEAFAGAVTAGPDDELEGAFVGGPFVGERFHRPAL